MPSTSAPDAFAGLGFAHGRLVRHSAEREHVPIPLVAAAGAGVLLFAGERAVVRMDGPSAVHGVAELDHARTHAGAPGPSGADPGEIFLGRFDGRPVFAASLPAEAAEAFPEPGHRVLDLRAVAAAGAVEAGEVALLATAKSLFAWHARNGFCANCGTATEARAGGFRRECPACAAHHFPRCDPVAIMLVRRGDRCLVGRGAHFPGRMYSCLAGFVEPGETIEAAVRRETEEETGIRVGAVRYHASQPWPFPHSLMIGCIAEAESEAITADPAELEDARWVDRDALRTMFEGRHPDGITAPQPLAIAHLLLRAFLDGAV